MTMAWPPVGRGASTAGTCGSGEDPGEIVGKRWCGRLAHAFFLVALAAVFFAAFFGLEDSAVSLSLDARAVGTPVFFSGGTNLPLAFLWVGGGGDVGGLGAGVAGSVAAAGELGRGIVAGQEGGGVRAFDGGDLFGRAVGDDLAAAFAAFGAEVDDPVGVADDVEVVLDDDDGVAEVGEAMEDVEELADVVEVEAGGGLVEEVEGAAGLALGELAGELHALGFAAGERGGGLAEVDVAEADVDEGLELGVDGGDVLEDGDGVFDGEVEDVGDGVAVELDRERLLVVAAAVADFAEDVDVGEEVHLDAALAFALAGFAAAALDVEGEAAGLVAALAGFGEHGEEVADGGEDAGVGGGVGARGAADGRLVDLDDFVDLVEMPRMRPCCAGLFAGAVELLARAR